MKTAFFALLFALVLAFPRVAVSQRWERGRGWEREHYRPRVYPVVPLPFVPVPRRACPVSCRSVNVCDGYGWCHWERHCEPWCG